MYELEELDNTHAIVMPSLLTGSQLEDLKSTQGVDGPVSWRLTLDQDLIDTLKGSFPNWFQNSPEATSPSSSSITTLPTETTLTGSGLCNGLITVQVATTDKSYQETLIHESFNGMAEGDRLGNPSASTGPSLFGTDGSNTTMTNCYDSRQSPPKAIVDSSPLQPAMDKNKESLKVKLMVRRPITQLVEQGIIPPLKTSPAIHEQCKQLERAKTGDLLKAKIQQRPDRQELERRHILEHDESHVDPSLAEKQRMLKKARLADQLNSQISHRPGPLELIKKNILHTEQPIERIVKEGLVSFKATSEGLLNRPQQPNSYITFEDDSQSSESDTRTSPARSDVIEAAAASAGIVTYALTIPTSGGTILQTKFHPTLIPTAASTAYIPPPPPLPNATNANKSTEQIQVKQDTSHRFAELCQSVAGPSPSPNFLPSAASPASLGSSTSTLSPLSSVASPPQSTTPRPAQSPLQQIQQSQKCDAPGKDKNRKKSKSKPVSKARTIKFHEYKGPPNAQKNSSLEPCTKESSYQLMLEQQNCLLRFLENLHKNRTILPAPPKTASSSIDGSVQSQPSNSTPMPSPALSVASSIPSSPAPSHSESVTVTTAPTTASDVAKLEKMKVSDLKAHLKKRNLPVSGPKPQLIERLRPYLPLESLESSNAPETMCSETCDGDVVNSPRQSFSPESEHESMDIQQVDSPSPSVISLSNDDIVREQQRKIDELQRQLELSKQELLQIKQNQQVMVVEQPTPPPPPINQKLVVKQQLEAKIQKQQAKQQAQLALRNKTPALIKPKEEPKPQPQPQPIQIQTHHPVQPQPINQIPIVWNGDTATVLLLGVQDNKKLVGGHQRTASLPSILLPIPTTTAPQTIQTIDQLIETKPIINQVIATHETIPQLQPTAEIKPPPPLYEEATKQLNSSNALKQENATVKKHIKSDNLTDILNILVKNGDISPSALDPTTPSTPGSVIMTQEILFNHSGPGSQIVQTHTHLDSQQQPAQLQQVRLQSQPQAQHVQLQIQPQPQQQLQQRSNSAQKAEVNVFDASLLLNTPQTPIQNMDLASPLQPDCHIDTENVASALDTFLQEHSVEPPANGDMAPYDDFDLLELMSQQLDMDISDETPCQNYTPMETNANASNTSSYQKSGLSSKRGMNPCLQPSINELIQQQEQQGSNNNGGSSASNNNDSSLNCNGLLNGFDPNSFDLGGSNNNFASTPMDVCDDFESHLNSFSFSSLSPDSNINTPPHPFSSALSTSTCSGSGAHNPLDFNHSSNSNGQLMNGTSDVDAFGSSGVNQDNLPELFNIDDYKMGWSVDFAV
ncbi:myocardin-related transcription factor A isoform X1 [Hermetia illucens]|nr:myocardin-related transcription factor A isoform X1 [Hermetia illucens]